MESIIHYRRSSRIEPARLPLPPLSSRNMPRYLLSRETQSSNKLLPRYSLLNVAHYDMSRIQRGSLHPSDLKKQFSKGIMLDTKKVAREYTERENVKAQV